LQEYIDRGLRVRSVADRLSRESFAAWVARVGDPFAGDDWDVLYQVPLGHDGVRGIADFLLRVVAPDGSVSIEPVDAKLARQEAKPGHVLQLSFYAEAIQAATGTRPQRMHLWLGSGQVESLLVADFNAYWQRLRARLARVLELEVTTGTAEPEPCSHCGFCEFTDVCDHSWRKADSLVYVAGLRSEDRALLQEAGVRTLAALAEQVELVPGWPAQRQARLVTQAWLQRQAREQLEGDRPPFLLIEAGQEPVWVMAWPCCRSLTTGTCSWTLRATRSGAPTWGCSSCSASSNAPRKAPGCTGRGGPTIRRRRARRWLS